MRISAAQSGDGEVPGALSATVGGGAVDTGGNEGSGSGASGDGIVVSTVGVIAEVVGEGSGTSAGVLEPTRAVLAFWSSARRPASFSLSILS